MVVAMLVTPAATAQLLTLRFNRLMGRRGRHRARGAGDRALPVATGSTPRAAPRSCSSRPRSFLAALAAGPADRRAPAAGTTGAATARTTLRGERWGRLTIRTGREPVPRHAAPRRQRRGAEVRAARGPVQPGPSSWLPVVCASWAAVGMPSRAPVCVVAMAAASDGPRNGLVERSALDHRGGHRAVERIARAGRVHGANRSGGGRHDPAAAERPRLRSTSRAPASPSVTMIAKRGPSPSAFGSSSDRAWRSGESPAGARPADATGLVGRERGELAPVRREDVGQPEDAPVEARCGGRVEDRACARAAGRVEGRAGGDGRDLVADEDDVVGHRARCGPAQP